jgi:hypothetical protein
MSFKDIRKNKTAPAQAAAPAPAPAETDVEALKAQLQKAIDAANAAAPKEVEATVEDDTENVVITGSESNSFLSVLTGGGASVDALLATVDTDGGGGSSPFPVLTQAAGVTGGAFQSVSLKSHANADLPEGKSPFIAVFLGYRLGVVAWPKPYDDTQKTPDKPVFTAAVPSTNSRVASLAMMAGRQHQYSSKRDTWAVAAGGPGMISPSIEMLLLNPETQELFVLRSCSQYNSAKDTRDQLLKQATETNEIGADGKKIKALLPFVGKFAPKSEHAVTSKGRKVVHHYPTIERIDTIDARGQAAWKVYADMAKNAPQDLRGAVQSWMAGEDLPLTPSVVSALEDGASRT